jgi:hypothetical protein
VNAASTSLYPTIKRLDQLLKCCHAGPVIAQFLLVPKEKVKGGQIGVTRGFPITVTLIRHLFLFRDDSLWEMSPMTWGFEKAKVEVLIKDIPSHKSHRSESPKFCYIVYG